MLNTEETGQSNASKLVAGQKNEKSALYNQDLRTYAKYVPQSISISKAWLPHTTNKNINKKNQETGADVIQIFQRSQDTDDFDELCLDDVLHAFAQTGKICVKFFKQITPWCNC